MYLIQNRIDDVIVFHSREKTHIHQIIDLLSEELLLRVKGLGISVDIKDSAKNFLVDRGYDAKFGARPLKRALQQYLEDPLAEVILSKKLGEGARIAVSHSSGKELLSLRVFRRSRTPRKKKIHKEGATE